MNNSINQTDVKLSIIIPVFNEYESLSELQERLHRVMEKLSSRYEIIYVNDGSTDRFRETMEKLYSDYPNVTVVSLDKHKGKSDALAAGFTKADGDWIITLDGDLQNPPEEIPKLLRFREDFDFIIGIRKNRKDNFSRKFASFLARFFRLVILGDITRDAGCGLFIFRKDILGFFPYFRNFFLYFSLLARAKGFSVKEVEIEHEERKYGKTKFNNILKRAWYGMLGIWGVLVLKNRFLKDRIRMP
ncbi:MAG: glycosyltransferase family 2 protein [Candidatus Omnitrophica bacterium]|nr:glycosyltransferase family 2 protein [Candidatus Omnitrophota bacterium]